MTISELQKQAHAIAKEKGWWDKPRDWPEICCLIHSELSEALEEYRRGRDVTEIRYEAAFGKPLKPLGFPIELADAVIRMMDWMECHGASLSYVEDPLEVLRDEVPSQEFLWEDKPPTVMDLLDCCHAALHASCWPNLKRVKLCLTSVQLTIETLNIDIEEAIKVKMAYNRQRSYRHGGKKA